MPIDPVAGEPVPIAGVPGLRSSGDLDAGFASDDPAALRLAYEAHGTVIFSFCRRSLGSDLAADVTQEVFVTAWRNRDRYDQQKGTLRSWLFGIARYKVLGAVRSRPPLHAVHDPAEEQERIDRSDIDRLADRLVLEEAMAGLSDRAREMLRLTYVEDLTAHLARAHDSVGRRVRVELDMPAATLNLNAAIPCALILNELVTNAFKHAFASWARPDDCVVTIGWRDAGASWHLTVSDNGPGLPAGADVAQPRTLGLRLVHMLARQLRGTVSYRSAPGCSACLEFPK